MKIDYETELFLVKKNKKIALLVTILLFSIIVGVTILILVFASYENKFLMKIIGIPILSILLIIFAYITNSYLITNIRKEKSMYNILYSYQEEYTGVVLAIKHNVHLPICKEGYELILQIDENEKMFYIPLFINDIKLRVNDKIKLITARNFVISYEVKDEKN